MVYVDDYGALLGRMRMCHMIADSDEELHNMIDKLGVDRRHHQAPPRHDSHYDICLSKKRLAITLGAKQITARQAAAMTARRRITGELGNPLDAEEWLRAHKNRERARSAA